MKTRLLLLVLSLSTFLCTRASAQCPPSLDVVWETQTDVDLYVALYPNCTLLDRLTIGETGGSNIDDLSGLDNIALNRLRFALTVTHTELTTLASLPERPGQEITITENDLLTDLGNFGSVFQFITFITITNNDLLGDCATDMICDAIAEEENVTISNNAGDCNSVADVEAACQIACHPDRPFLDGLYEALDGDNWETDTRRTWSDADDCDICDWPFITCDANERVTEIRIIDDGLGGDLLNLDWTLIPQLLAFELESDRNINNGPTGPLPDGLFDLPLIREIIFSYGQFSLLPTNLAAPDSLRTLILNDEFKLGRFTSLPPLGNLQKLERLIIDRTDLGGELPADIGTLVNLRELELSAKLSGNFTFDGNLPDLSNLDKLERLELTELPNVTSWNAMAASLANKPLLTAMQLEAKNLASPALPASLPGLPAIDTFQIATDQTGEVPFLPNSTALTRYWVTGDLLTRPASLEVAPTTTLTFLNLSENRFGGEIFDIPSAYSSLRTIFLNQNDFTGDIPESYNIASLRQLNLRGNDLSGFLPEFLGDLNFNFTNSLDLSENEFVGCYPDSYTSLYRFSTFSGYRFYANFDGNDALNDFADFAENGNACLPGCSEDYEVLLDFYFANDGENWTRTTGWEDIGTGNCDVSTYEGITVDGDGRVTEISLPSNNLSGELFADLGSLDQLTLLNLSVNNLTGCYPSTYDAFCGGGIVTNFFNNAGLPNNGSVTFFNDRFCGGGDVCGDDCPSLPVTLTSDTEIADYIAFWPNCQEIAVDMTLTGPAITTLAGLDAYDQALGDLTIDGINATTLGPLSELISIAGNLTIESCPSLTTIPMTRLDSIGGSLVLDDLPLLTDGYDFSNLVSLGGDLSFIETGITAFGGFDQLTGAIPGALILNDNDDLVTINFSTPANNRSASITSVGELIILGNAALTDLAGLGDFVILGDLSIVLNSLLTDCAIQPVCDRVADGSATIQIAANGVGCSNTSEVQAACLALPVTWVDFRAAAGAKSVGLKWVTADEVDNDYFSIERSTDGLAWAGIGEVAAAGPGTGTHHEYGYTDEAPLAGTTLYRLRQVDYDGTHDFSPVRTVNFSAEGVTKAYPNPYTSELTLYSAEPDVAILTDLTGRELARYPHAGGELRVTPGLRAGVYVVRFLEAGTAIRIIAK